MLSSFKNAKGSSFLFEGLWRGPKPVSLLFKNPKYRLVLNKASDISAFFNELEELKNKFYLAGYFSYELGYILEPSLNSRTKKTVLPLADFYIYEKPIVLDSEYKPRSSEKYSIQNSALSLDKAEYIRAINAIKDLIESGDIYQINYTMKLNFDLVGSLAAMYHDMRSRQGADFNVLAELEDMSILSFSPELFFRQNADKILVKPMKGTAERGLDSIGDLFQAKYLNTDPKNQSENLMIVDLLRNDLAKISVPGSVKVDKLFEIEKYKTLFQMTSTIESILRSDINISQLIAATFPSGSVTGAPKIRSMEVINDYEKTARGIYTGSIGYFSPDGSAVFNVAIRTAVISNGLGEMGLGSGIVYDSDPSSEFEECRLKAAFMTNKEEEFKLIETMLYDDHIKDLELHLKRLENSAEYFMFKFDPKDVREILKIKLADIEEGLHKVRILLSKDGDIEVSIKALADKSQEYKIRFAKYLVDSKDRFLYHKTTKRALYEKERARAVTDGFFDVIFYNEKEEITEGTISNIIVKKSGQFFTPSLESGLLNGITRRKMIAEGSLIERVLYKKDILGADELYICNSIIGLARAQLLI